jgi:DNA modification methylase
MNPYYDHAGITIYNADCRLILPTLPKCDLLLTDPPYGIGEEKHHGRKCGGKALSEKKDYGYIGWDEEPADKSTLDSCRALATHSIIWGGNYFELPIRGGWLVWDKVNGSNPWADCELAWTDLDISIRKFTHQWMGMLQEDMSRKETRVHPTQKPLALMKWCLSLFPDAKTVLDPFAGSGTTLVAAKAMGLTAIGIELHEPYCEIAAKRLSQEVFDFGGDAA